ncbi:recombinase family protein [Spirosoma sp. RP8]|uniref:Recombinase family protein n=1 Tax=Spirosoma liriopis TaxID=2937440 RepID=A0ABT0HUU3_9BACT|nr:recombinase family protein [Spirosoma liriopis]MCK8495882.1 recombinase family protein [Spirosoma liriopis]
MESQSLSYIAYYRVSTKQQGQSGLGLEAQRNQVLQFIGSKARLVREFVEVESGKQDSRPQLTEALSYARKHRARLVIAKLDRLSRNASFIFALKDSGADFVCADMPDANTLTIGIFATLAQHERELIGERTRKALAAKKQQGFQLGSPQNLTPLAQQKGVAAIKKKAATNENNQRAMLTIRGYLNQDKTLQQIADELNAAGFRTAKGYLFQRVQVLRLMNKLIKN